MTRDGELAAREYVRLRPAPRRAGAEGRAGADPARPGRVRDPRLRRPGQRAGRYRGPGRPRSVSSTRGGRERPPADMGTRRSPEPPAARSTWRAGRAMLDGGLVVRGPRGRHRAALVPGAGPGRRRAIEEDAIAAELERDRTDAGRRRAAAARAARPTRPPRPRRGEVVEDATLPWRAGPSHGGFQQPGQRTLLEPYVARYFEAPARCGPSGSSASPRVRAGTCTRTTWSARRRSRHRRVPRAGRRPGADPPPAASRAATAWCARSGRGPPTPPPARAERLEAGQPRQRLDLRQHVAPALRRTTRPAPGGRTGSGSRSRGCRPTGSPGRRG